MLAFGSMVERAREVTQKVDATVYDMRFVKPVDRQAVKEAGLEHDLLVTMEENVIMGGAGDACFEVLAAEGLTPQILQIGIPDKFITHGDTDSLMKECGLDSDSIIQKITERLTKSE